MNMRQHMLAAVSLLGMTACASTSETLEDAGDPVTTSTGQVAPQRNLLLSDLSVGSPGNGGSIDEVFDLPLTGFRVATTDDGANDPQGLATLGLVKDSTFSDFYGTGHTMTYYSDTNTFVFEAETDAGTITASVQNAQVQDPVDTPGIENSGVAKLIYANPLYSFAGAYGDPIHFQDVWDLGLGDGASISEITAELTRLQESENEADNDFYEEISTAANNYIQAGDQMYYGYSFTGGNGYVEFTNMNDDNEENVTDTVAIVSLKEFYETGEEFHAHGVIGHRTPLEEMPTSGSATYQGKVVGDVLTNNSIRSLTGSVTLEADFISGQVDMTLATIIREGGNNAGGTTFLDYKTLEGSGSISDTTFEGSLVEIGGDALGSYQGAFFGPVANEVGGTWEFGDDASYAAGAFTGAKLDD